MNLVAMGRRCWAPVLAGLLITVGLVVCFPVLRFFIDAPSFLITVGGTAAVTFLSFSSRDLLQAAWMVVDALRSHPRTVDTIISELRRLALVYRRGGVKSLEAEEKRVADPFMRVAVAKVADWQGEEEITEALAGEIIGFERQIGSAGKVLQTVGRLLPAFGLIGTLISLVLLLRGSSGPDPLAMAPSLSLAVLTTLYGALLSNVVIVPLATKVETRGEVRLTEMGVIAEGALLMAQNERPAAIAERLTILANRLAAGEPPVSQELFTPAGRRGGASWMRSGMPALWWRFDLGGWASGVVQASQVKAPAGTYAPPASNEQPAALESSSEEPDSKAA